MILLLWEFFTLASTGGFLWSLSDCQSLRFSRTLLSFQADLNSAVVWMVSTCVLISNSSSPFTDPLVTIPSRSITIGIIVTFVFHSFFTSLAGPGTYLSFRLPSILLCGLPGRQSPQFGKFSVFYWQSLGLVVWLRLKTYDLRRKWKMHWFYNIKFIICFEESP